MHLLSEIIYRDHYGVNINRYRNEWFPCSRSYPQLKPHNASAVPVIEQIPAVGNSSTSGKFPDCETVADSVICSVVLNSIPIDTGRGRDRSEKVPGQLTGISIHASSSEPVVPSTSSVTTSSLPPHSNTKNPSAKITLKERSTYSKNAKAKVEAETKGAAAAASESRKKEKNGADKREIISSIPRRLQGDTSQVTSDGVSIQASVTTLDQSQEKDVSDKQIPNIDVGLLDEKFSLEKIVDAGFPVEEIQKIVIKRQVHLTVILLTFNTYYIHRITSTALYLISIFTYCSKTENNLPDNYCAFK